MILSRLTSTEAPDLFAHVTDLRDSIVASTVVQIIALLHGQRYRMFLISVERGKWNAPWTLQCRSAWAHIVGVHWLYIHEPACLTRQPASEMPRWLCICCIPGPRQFVLNLDVRHYHVQYPSDGLVRRDPNLLRLAQRPHVRRLPRPAPGLLPAHAEGRKGHSLHRLEQTRFLLKRPGRGGVRRSSARTPALPNSRSGSPAKRAGCCSQRGTSPRWPSEDSASGPPCACERQNTTA